MRVILDENLPRELAVGLVGHQASTVAAQGWEGITNGELLRRIGGRFDVMLTMDRNLPHQQNLTGLAFGLVLIRAPSNRLIHLRPLVPAVLMILPTVRPGQLVVVGA